VTRTPDAQPPGARCTRPFIEPRGLITAPFTAHDSMLSTKKKKNQTSGINRVESSPIQLHRLRTEWVYFLAVFSSAIAMNPRPSGLTFTQS
jgi:hypothetical protein